MKPDVVERGARRSAERDAWRIVSARSSLMIQLDRSGPVSHQIRFPVRSGLLRCDGNRLYLRFAVDRVADTPPESHVQDLLAAAPTPGLIIFEGRACSEESAGLCASQGVVRAGGGFGDATAHFARQFCRCARAGCTAERFIARTSFRFHGPDVSPAYTASAGVDAVLSVLAEPVQAHPEHFTKGKL
jgi:hypothetical protein